MVFLFCNPFFPPNQRSMLYWAGGGGEEDIFYEFFFEEKGGEGGGEKMSFGRGEKRMNPVSLRHFRIPARSFALSRGNLFRFPIFFFYPPSFTFLLPAHLWSHHHHPQKKENYANCRSRKKRPRRYIHIFFAEKACDTRKMFLEICIRTGWLIFCCCCCPPPPNFSYI